MQLWVFLKLIYFYFLLPTCDSQGESVFIIDKFTFITATNTMVLALGLEAVVRSLDSDLLNHFLGVVIATLGGIRFQAHGFEQDRQVFQHRHF